MEAEKKALRTEKKTARQKEQEARKLKEKQKQEVYRLYNAGMPPDEIEKRVGVKRRTIYNWLKNVKF